MAMTLFKKIISGFAAASIAAMVQFVAWDFLKPLIWILFYPAAFIAAGWGGLACGLTTGIFAIFYALFIFIEPSFSLSTSKIYELRSAIFFLPIIYFMGDLQERYQKLRDNLASSLKLSEESKEKILRLYEKNAALQDVPFAEFADSLPQIVWVTDPAGKNIYFNNAWMSYTGMTLSESLGDGWNTPFHPDDRLNAWNAWQNATQNQAEYALECRLRKSDGTYRWWLIRGTPVKNFAGTIQRWFGTCTDIDDIKNVYADLALEKSRLQTILDSSPEGLAIIDRDGQYSLFNQRFMSYFELEDASAFANGYQKFAENFEILTSRGLPFPPEKYPVHRSLAGETVLDQEVFLRNKTTGRKWYGSHSTAPVKDVHGTVTGVVISVSDVSVRVQGEIERINLLNDQNLILNSGVVGIAKTTKERRFLWVNSAFAENFGYTREELVGQTSRILYPSEEAYKGFGSSISSDASQVGGILRKTIELQKKDGTMAWFLVGGGRVSEDSEDAIWMSVDVTQERKNQALMESYLHRLEKSVKESLILLSRAVEMHDPYTAGHQSRVGEIAEGIGKVMGLPVQQTDNLKLIGLIHDIGKIGIPAEILSKPGKLSDEELALVRSHAKIGYEILKNASFDIPVADVAYHHHERLDGSGYPQALKGEEISLESRIIAVADVLEAMSSHRPYRASLGIDLALEEIQLGKGVKYDAKVVDACIQFISETGWKPNASDHRFSD